MKNVPHSALTDWDLKRIGTMLVPLWDQSCRLKIEEFALDSPMQGDKLHPVFEAIRSTIKMISKIESDRKIKAPRPRRSGDEPEEEERDDTLFGNPD